MLPDEAQVTRSDFDASIAELEKRGHAPVELDTIHYEQPCGDREIAWSAAALAQAFDDGVLVRPLPLRWDGSRGDVQVAFALHGLVLRVLEDGTALLSPVRATSHLTALVAAFERLGEHGIVAGAHRGNTQSSGWEDVVAIGRDRGLRGSIDGIYWHEQSHDAFDSEGMLTRRLALHWGGDRERIASAMRESFRGLPLRLDVPETDTRAFLVTGAPVERPFHCEETFGDAVRRVASHEAPMDRRRFRHRIEELYDIAALVSSDTACVGVGYMPGVFGDANFNVFRPFVLASPERTPVLFPVDVHMAVGPGRNAMALGPGETVVFGTRQGLECFGLNGEPLHVVTVQGGVSALAVSADRKRIAAIGSGSLYVYSWEETEAPRLDASALRCCAEGSLVALDPAGQSVFVFWKNQIARRPSSLDRDGDIVELDRSIAVERVFPRARGDFFVQTRSGGLALVSEHRELIWHWKRDNPYSIPHFTSDGEDVTGFADGGLFRLEGGRKVLLKWPFFRKGCALATHMGGLLVASAGRVLEVAPFPTEVIEPPPAPEPAETATLEPLQVGDSVRVLRGAFESFSGSVSAITPSGRVVVVLRIFGREAPTELDRTDVEIAS